MTLAGTGVHVDVTVEAPAGRLASVHTAIVIAASLRIMFFKRSLAIKVAWPSGSAADPGNYARRHISTQAISTLIKWVTASRANRCNLPRCHKSVRGRVARHRGASARRRSQQLDQGGG